jgi:hypothetical protein
LRRLGVNELGGDVCSVRNIDLLWPDNFSEIFMKYNFSKEWCEKMALAEIGHEIGAGTQELAQCPTCRGAELEKSWCETCARTGVILVKRELPAAAP